MSTDLPDRPGTPDMPDDLDQAYARAHALADDGRGPAASVRANVLAAAVRMASGEDAQDAKPRLVPVAPPVAAVGRGRGRAINLSSWRVRSGAALCAMLLVGLAVWRFDQNGRLGGGVQVALAELRLAEPRTAAPPQDLPLPAAAAAASYPYAAPPAVVEDPLDNGASARARLAKQAPGDKDIVVAQLEQQHAAERRALAQSDQAAQARRPLPAAAPPVAADAATSPAPVVVASNGPRAQGALTEQESATVTITAAAAPPEIMTSPPHPPSVLPRRVMVVPRTSSSAAEAEAKVSRSGNTVVASADTTGRAAEGERVAALSQASADARAKAAVAAPAAPVAAAPMAPAPVAAAPQAEPDGVAAARARPFAAADAAKKAAPSPAGTLAGASLRSSSPAALQSAADRDDVDALKTLLADPATRVDARDADGRTALLHAVLAQHPAAVRLLLAAGADPARADHAGLTPRQAAQTGASAEIAALLGAGR